MPKPDTRFWTGFAISLLGLAVGVSNLIRGTDDGSSTGRIVLGAVCIILATGWLAYLLVRMRRRAHSQGS